MENKSFVGIGPNPEGPDLPLGLGMNLMADPKAREAFDKMTNSQKESLIGYLQSAASGEEAESRMAHAIKMLRDNEIQF